MKEVIQGAVETLRDGRPCVLATVVRTKGSTPQKAGAMLLVKDDGSGLGTLGGGCVEGDIWFAAKEMLRDGSGPEFKDYYLNEDIAARDGLVCGGTIVLLPRTPAKPGRLSAPRRRNPRSIRWRRAGQSGHGREQPRPS